MKTRKTIIIVCTTILAVAMFYLYITANGFSFYNEGLALRYLSDYELQKEFKADYLKGVEIKSITDEDLKSVPKIKELIEKALKKEFPLNRTGKVLSDIDTLLSNHKHYAVILAEKYSKDPSDFMIYSDVEEEILQDYPDAVRIDFGACCFEYNGQQYRYGNTRAFLNYEDNLVMIEVYKVKNPLDPQRATWAELTDKDLDDMPTLREAIDNIGSKQENIEVQKGTSHSTNTLH